MTDTVWHSPKNWYSQWWRPANLKDDFIRETAQYTNAAFFSSSFKSARECYVASSFAGLLPDQPCVRLECGDFPDFRLCDGRVERLYEITEALPQARKRHAEYKNKKWRTFPEPESIDDLAVPMIQAAISRKAQKHYSQRPHLVVYAYASTRTASKILEAEFGDADAFETVHVLVYGQLVKLLAR